MSQSLAGKLVIVWIKTEVDTSLLYRANKEKVSDILGSTVSVSKV